MEFRYDIALSFAGEDREFAEYIATILNTQARVFYDHFEEGSLWGSDLSESLPSRYIASRFCVILQSDEYIKKMWTTLERQSIVLEFLKRRGKDFILPVRVRGCTAEIPGVSLLIGYVSAHSESDWPRIVSLLIEKLTN